MTTAEQNRAAYERFCREVLTRGQLEVIDELVADSVRSHSPFPGQAPGREGFKQAFAQFRSAFSDIRITTHNLVAGEDRVVGHFSVRAVQSGDFMGIPATGKAVSYDEMVIVRFEAGKIVEHWSVADTLAMMQTLGVVADVSRLGAEGRRPSEERLRQVESFFASYAELFNRSLRGEKIDVDDVAGSFAPYFVQASPGGVQGGKNGILFRWLIPRGFAHYRKIGTKQMTITGIELEPLDPQHALAKVHWDSRYEKKDGGDERIEFEVTYLLHFHHGEPKIFGYIAGDEQRALREHGIA